MSGAARHTNAVMYMRHQTHAVQLPACRSAIVVHTGPADTAVLTRRALVVALQRQPDTSPGMGGLSSPVAACRHLSLPACSHLTSVTVAILVPRGRSALSNRPSLDQSTFNEAINWMAIDLGAKVRAFWALWALWDW